MDNYSNDNRARRYSAHVSIWGTSQIHKRNPYIIAWWSAAFPGFGHLLLSKYIRGFLLFIWEVVININAKVNLAMIYSFQGDIRKAIEILDTRWLLIYIPVYIFGIWDSYRTTVDLNKISILANREKKRFNSFSLGALEINYLDKRNPVLSVIWSLFVPGLGQLYIHRVLSAFFVVVWTVVFAYYSRSLEAISLLFIGDVAGATEVLEPEWLLFFPSIYGFSVYDSYMNTVENNKLFKQEQNSFLEDKYQVHNFKPALIRKGDSKMQIFSTFLNGTFLELAISSLEENGVKKSEICAVPLNNRKVDKRLLDTLHHSDGTSLVDIGFALATAFSVVGASIGFELEWGPIYWGLIAAFVGFVIGFLIRLYIENVLKKKKRVAKGDYGEVVLIVNCEKEEVDLVEKVLWEHSALGVAKLK